MVMLCCGRDEKSDQQKRVRKLWGLGNGRELGDDWEGDQVVMLHLMIMMMFTPWDGLGRMIAFVCGSAHHNKQLVAVARLREEGEDNANAMRQNESESYGGTNTTTKQQWTTTTKMKAPAGRRPAHCAPRGEAIWPHGAGTSHGEADGMGVGEGSGWEGEGQSQRKNGPNHGQGGGALFRLLFPSSSPPSIHPAALWWKNGPAAAGKEEHAVIKNDVAPGGTNHGLSRTNILLENNGGAELQKESESSSAAVVGHKFNSGGGNFLAHQQPPNRRREKQQQFKATHACASLPNWGKADERAEDGRKFCSGGAQRSRRGADSQSAFPSPGPAREVHVVEEEPVLPPPPFTTAHCPSE
ncbi:hypothetical protein niasHT_027158 [Heterodera trifolii]|uniref:Uncharacterized protein n=1 Tax=Heterodera trifolii TaxID=157864 RepID=A0ABD2JIM1_9BILA